jgi:hypothetical protein
MTIEKAIKILSDLLHSSSREESPDSWGALSLGREALERVLDVRRFPEGSNWRPLTGETKEEG